MQVEVLVTVVVVLAVNVDVEPATVIVSTLVVKTGVVGRRA